MENKEIMSRVNDYIYYETLLTTIDLKHDTSRDFFVNRKKIACEANCQVIISDVLAFQPPSCFSRKPTSSSHRKYDQFSCPREFAFCTMVLRILH